MPEPIPGQGTNLGEGELNELNKGPELGGEGKPAEGEGGKGEGDAPETFNVGGKEYTAEQIEKMEKKGIAYDQLLPEFTKKSQRLSELDKADKKVTDPVDPPYYDPEWVPKTYKELGAAIKMAEKRGEEKALAHLKGIETQRTEAKDSVDNFVKETKTKDKFFDESDFFEYIQRHKITVKSADDLGSVYSTYKEARDAGAEGADKARKKILLRRKDTVGGPGGGKGTGFHVPIQKLRQSGSAQEAASEAFKNLKK